MNDIDVRFGNFIKGKRKEKKMTQEELAKLLRIPRTTYQHYEKGETQATLEFIQELIRVMGIDVQEFFDREKNYGK